VRGFACVSEWFGKSGPVLDTEIINPFGVGSSFTLSMILRAAYHRIGAWVKRKGNKREEAGRFIRDENVLMQTHHPPLPSNTLPSCSRDHERPFIHDFKKR